MIKKVIFDRAENCNFGEQGLWFEYEGEGYDDIVTDCTITSEAEAVAWLSENYKGEWEIVLK